MKDRVVIVKLADKLSEIGHTKGPDALEFGQTLEMLTQEFGRISSIGTQVHPRGVQSNGLRKVEVKPSYPLVKPPRSDDS